MADEPMAHLVGRKLGDFVLREQIGEGGYAVVYRCEQQQLGRDVVVKVLHERGRYTDAALDRFQREARLASQLDHPYAAHVYAFGAEDDGVLWIAMELVHGVALADWLEANGPMPLAQFVPFFERVAEVVHAAHERGIVHRLLRTIAHRAAVNAVAFATTGRDIVSGAVDGSLLVTREGGAQVVLPASSGGIDTASFLPDGRVVAADAQRQLRIYSPGGALLAAIELPARVMSLRIAGTGLVTVPSLPRYAGSAAVPLLLDYQHYRIIAQLAGHVGRVFSARWVAGDQIVTAGADGTVRLWDGSTGRLRQIYQGSSRSLVDATLVSDNLVVAGGTDGMLRLWDRDSERPLWTLHAHASPIIGVHVEDGDIVTRGFTGELARWRLPSSDEVIKSCAVRERCATMLK